MFVFEKLTQTLAGNGLWKVGIAGRFFRVAVAAYPLTVQLLKDNRIVGSAANMQAGDYVEGTEFDAVWITNGYAGQAVTVQVGSGGAGSDRVVGEVSVIDGGRFRTESDQAFIGLANAAQVAAQYPMSQLWNPAASGKNLYLEAVVFSSTGAQQVRIGHYNAAYASNGLVMNKRVGAGAGVGQTRQTNNVEQLATGSGLNYQVAANAPQTVNFREPLMICEGFGVVVYGDLLNSNIYVGYEWFEQAV